MTEHVKKTGHYFVAEGRSWCEYEEIERIANEILPYVGEGATYIVEQLLDVAGAYQVTFMRLSWEGAAGYLNTTLNEDGSAYISLSFVRGSGIRLLGAKTYLDAVFGSEATWEFQNLIVTQRYGVGGALQKIWSSLDLPGEPVSMDALAATTATKQAISITDTVMLSYQPFEHEGNWLTIHIVSPELKAGQVPNLTIYKRFHAEKNRVLNALGHAHVKKLTG